MDEPRVRVMIAPLFPLAFVLLLLLEMLLPSLISCKST
jgi:hypothetical protein